MFRISLEYCRSWVLVRKRKLYAQVDSAQHSRIKILLSVGSTNQQNVSWRLKTIDFSQESRKNSSTGFMHVTVSTSSQSVDFINKNNYFTDFFARLPKLRELFLTLTIILTHDGFDWHVNEGNVHLLSNDFGTGGFASSWRALKEHSFWSVLLEFHSCSFCDFIVDFRVVQS